MELRCRINYLRNIFTVYGGEPERMPRIVISSSLECLERLVILRERTVKEHLMRLAGFLDVKYHNYFP